ncbi:MAG: hypothetical protein Q7V04_08455 [Deltaproteobacteria bacterium]|nr:hypothetical protein [Deltaproteobacteria bacterium]
MNPIIPIISVVLVFTLLPAIYGAYIKLSARLLRYQGISWKQGFVFGLIIVICSALIRAALLGFRHSLLPLAQGILVVLLANWLIGSWYFSGRGANTEGGALGWGRAAKLTGVALVMLGFTAAILITVPKMLVQNTIP